MGIADKLACLVACVVTAFVMIVLTSLYFTGLPLLRDIPFIGHVPLIGAIAEGEIGRRTASARSAGELAERLIWQEQQRKAEAQADADRQARQMLLDAMAISHNKEIADLKAQNAQLISEIEQKAADDEKTANADGACHCAPAVSKRVRDDLANIGRQTPHSAHQ